MAIPSFEELMTYPKEANISLDNVKKIAECDDSDYKCIIGEKDGHYYLFENSNIESHNGVKEVALVSNSFSLLRFEYTPDDLHRWFITCNAYTKIASKPEPLRLDFARISPGMSCTYNGITLTYNAPDSVTIKMDEKSRIMKVERDHDYTYKFLKTKIKAINGADGFYSHMEQIAEHSKIDPFPFCSYQFDSMEKLFTDPKLIPNKCRQLEK